MERCYWTCNITSAWAVDREFVNIYWAHLGPNFTQVRSNWSRIGSNWLPIWTPFGPQGIPLAPLGPHWEPGPVWEPRELSNAMPAHKICVLGTRRGIRGIRRIRRSGGRTRGSDPHPTRAGGQDDGSYTNSLKPQEARPSLPSGEPILVEIKPNRDPIGPNSGPKGVNREPI